MAHESVLHHRLLWSLTEVQRWACASVQTNKSLFPLKCLTCSATIQPVPTFITLPLRLTLTHTQTVERQKQNDRKAMNLRAKLTVKVGQRAGNELGKTWREKEREQSIHEGRLGACEPWQHGLKPSKRNTPLQWQIRLIRDDPWKTIGVLTAGERPWPRSPGCITAGKCSCQGQAGHQLSTMPPCWRHTDWTPSTLFFYPSGHRTLHSITETFPGQSVAQLHFGV